MAGGEAMCRSGNSSGTTKSAGAGRPIGGELYLFRYPIGAARVAA